MVSGRFLFIAGEGEPRLRLVEKVYCTTQGGGGRGRHSHWKTQIARLKLCAWVSWG